MKILILILIHSMSSAALQSFRLDYTSGKKIQAFKKNGKEKVLVFLSSGCPCSQAQFDHLNKLAKDNKNVDFIGINSNKSTQQTDAQSYYNGFKVNFPIIDDKSLELANKYRALKTPHIFIINEANKLLYQGAITNKRNPMSSSKFYLRDNLQALNKNTPLPYTESKAIGCYIGR